LTDLDGNDRFVNVAVNDKGMGTAPLIDMGAFENQSMSFFDPPGVGDDTCDGGSSNGAPCSFDGGCPGGRCGLKSRYITVTAPLVIPDGTPVGKTIQITIVTMNDAPDRVGDVWWVGPSGPIADAPNGTLVGAQVLCEPSPSNVEIWPAGNLHLYGESIVPHATYAVRACDEMGNNCTDPPLIVETSRWGDIVAPFDGGSQPNFADINAANAKFQENLTAPEISRTDMAGIGAPGTPNVPNQEVNFADINAVVAGFQGSLYPFTVPACP